MGTHSGDVKNALVRVILSKIGAPCSVAHLRAAEPETIAYFDHLCACCGKHEPTEFDHAIPFNRKDLGPHQIWNRILAFMEDRGRPQQSSEAEVNAFIRARLEEARTVIDRAIESCVGAINEFQRKHGPDPSGAKTG